MAEKEKKSMTGAPKPVMANRDSFFKDVGIDLTWTGTWPLRVKSETPVDEDVLRFAVPAGTQNNFLFYQDMRLLLWLKLRDKNGGVLKPNDMVIPTNNIGGSLFSDVKLTLNSVQVTAGTNGLYSFWHYMFHLLNFEEGKQKNLLASQGFVPTYESDWNKWKKDPAPGYKTLREYFGNYTGLSPSQFAYNTDSDGPTCLIAPVLTDFTSVDVPLISQIEGKLELHRTRKDFALHTLLPNNKGYPAAMLDDREVLPARRRRKHPEKSGGEGSEEDPPSYDELFPEPANDKNNGDLFEELGAKIHIVDAELLIPVKTMNPSLDLKIEDKLKTHVMEYPSIRVDMRKYTMAKGQQSFSFNNIKDSQNSPDRMFLIMVPDYQMSGRRGWDPFNFSNEIKAENDPTAASAKLTTIRATVNNDSLEMFETTDFNMTTLRKYVELNEALGYDRTSPGSVSFTPRDFQRNKFIMAYDFTKARISGRTDNYVKGVVKEGNLLLNLEFDNPLPCATFLIAFGEYRASVKSDFNRNIWYKYIAA